MTFDARALAGRHRDEKPRPAETAEPKSFPLAAPGSYDAGATIQLSDGRRTAGVDTLEAARMAAERNVHVYVIGLERSTERPRGEGGMAIHMRLDEPTLREVARMTGGKYH